MKRVIVTAVGVLAFALLTPNALAGKGGGTQNPPPNNPPCDANHGHPPCPPPGGGRPTTTTSTSTTSTSTTSTSTTTTTTTGGGGDDPCTADAGDPGILTDDTAAQTLFDGGLNVAPLFEDPDADGEISGQIYAGGNGTPLEFLTDEGACALDLLIAAPPAPGDL